jgi:hypothetical protein
MRLCEKKEFATNIHISSSLACFSYLNNVIVLNMKQAMEETISDKVSRARRRQSDARWRASVASCYETLRLTIPVNKRATRRIAKVLILDLY